MDCLKPKHQLFSYDASGNVVSVDYSSNGGSTFTTYYYLRNMQGDIVKLIDISGNTVVEYRYDSWGKQLSCTGTLATTLGMDQPFRYRGYVYDMETGFYLAGTRYYDSVVGRWISPEPNVYQGDFDDGAGLVGYNVYAYCANNPANFTDPTGEFIVTALIVGALAGAIIGGTVGGVVSYNAAKESGKTGSDIFWATVGGVEKGAVVGGVAGGLIGATGGVVATYGVGTVAGTALISGTLTVAAKTTEVTALQIKKSTSEGKSGWQTANNVMNSVFINGGRILTPVPTKIATTTATWLVTDIAKHKVIPLAFNTYLGSTRGKWGYAFSAYAWVHTAYSIFSNDPVARADQRRYTLR